MNGQYFRAPDYNPDKIIVEQENFYINLLRNNNGKKIKVYANYLNSIEWKDKIFSGIIESSSENHLILSDPSSGSWYLIKLEDISFVEFEEKIT